MPVTTMRHRAAHRFVTILLVALVVSYGGSLFAQQTDNNAQLDIFVFNQEDHGGNKIQNEEMLYVGARASAKLKVNKVLTIRPTISGALLYAGGKPNVPSTITNATTTSASQRSSNRAGGKSDYTPVTTSMGFDIKPIGSDWTLSPGAFFSWQDNYVSRGLDFSASVELFNGNFIPSFSYGFRWDSLTAGKLGLSGIFGVMGEGGEGGEGGDGEEDKGDPTVERAPPINQIDTRWTHNFQFGFTQILSPEWRLNASVQYTLQHGSLSAPNAVLTLYDQNKVPVLFANEKLPKIRNRLQFNTRVRFSPVTGWGIGADHSFYIDDWGIMNVAIEPQVDGYFVPEVALWRAWYRYSYQWGTRFHRGHPTQEYRYQTDDADLLSFSTHRGGALFFFRLARWGELDWNLRVSGYAFSRSDHILGYGGLVGIEFDW